MMVRALVVLLHKNGACACRLPGPSRVASLLPPVLGPGSAKLAVAGARWYQVPNALSRDAESHRILCHRLLSVPSLKAAKAS